MLNALSNYIDEKGYVPSIREVGGMVNLASASTVYNHIEKLKDKGFITWEPGQPRTIQILKNAS